MKVKEFLKKHKKWCIAAVILIVVIAGAGSFISRAKRAGNMAAMIPAQETAEVELRSLMETVSATGTVVSAQSKNISVNLSDVEVMEVNVKVGDSVEAGDVICVLDSTDLEEDLADAQTTLNATSGKTAIEVASAERGLDEAETTRDIEAIRAQEDEDEAYNDYLWAKTDEEEAEDDYKEAQEATVIKNGEWEAAKESLEDAEDDLEDAEAVMEAAKKKMEKLAEAAGVSTSDSNGESFKTANASSLEAEFLSTVNEIKSLVSKFPDDTGMDVSSNLYITSDSLSSYSADDFVGSSADSSTIDSINNSLGTLVGLAEVYQTLTADEESSEQAQEAYEEAKTAYEAAYAEYQKALSAYQEAQSETSTWESKYNSAKSSESSYEKTYESAVKNTDSYYDTYEQKIRNTEDTTRNNDSTVSSKEDSLATSRLSATTADLSEKQQIRQLEEQIEDCTVTAPISGIITSLNVEEGDTYSSASGTIAVIENTAAYEVEAEIDEYDISLIEVGQQVVVKTNGTGDTELDGTVTEVAPRASSDNSSSDVSYKITVSVDTPCDDLRLDMTAKLSIIIESKENVLTVPYDAVQEAEDGTYYVEVTDGNTGSPETADSDAEPAGMQRPGENGSEGAGPNTVTTRRMTVEKGIESDYYIEIISDEITEGMQVIVQSSDDSGDDFKGMVGRQGPMGGF